APQVQPEAPVRAAPEPKVEPPVFAASQQKPALPAFAPPPPEPRVESPAFVAAEQKPAPPVFTPPPPERVLDLSHLDEQLRGITARIEALRPSSDLEASVKGIRADLAEIAGLITSALPQRALDSLEIEIKALGDRIEHSRQSGVDTGALVGLEHGLNE